MGALTALALVLIIRTADRFQCDKQTASYLGPAVGGVKRVATSTGAHHETSQFALCVLLVEAAQVTVRSDQEWRNRYSHLAMRRGRKIAKVAMARKLAIGLYWMWRKGWVYEQMRRFGSHARQPGNRDGVQSNTE